MNFKKILAFLLSLAMIVFAIMPVAFAESTESTETQKISTTENEKNSGSSSLSDNSVIYSCVYDHDRKKINISGTVNHDVMVNHNDYFIEVYRILPGQAPEDVLSADTLRPLASSAISVKFQFSIDASNTYYRFSRYVVVLRAPSGELLLTNATYATVSTTYSYQQSNAAFKGIESLIPSVASGIDAGTAIIPVYMERLLNPVGHGYMYSINSTYRYFDEAYITELDKQVRTYSACGTRVYLQMLLSDYSLAYQKAPSVGALYYMPDVYEEEVLSQVSAFAEFLADRYGDYQSGTIHGLILGTKIDQSKMNNRSDLSLTEYAQRYAFYLYAMAASARSVNSSLDIVVPFSSNNSYATLDQEKATNNDVMPSECLEAILLVIRENHLSELPFNMMIETSALPSQLTMDSAPTDEILPESSEMNVDNISLLLEYLDVLKKTEKNVPQHVMFCWDLPKQLSGNPLASAYVYSYAKLLQYPQISTFVMNFSSDLNNGNNQLLDLESVLSTIDTDKKMDMLASIEPSFDEESWDHIVSAFKEKNQQNTVIFPANRINPNEIFVNGSFSYFDFENGNLGDWTLGAGCADIKSAYGIDGARTMELMMQPSNAKSREEALCLYEFYENLNYTPYMKIDLALNSLSGALDEIYEVRITIGDTVGSISYEYLLHGQEKHSLWMDLSAYNQEHVAKYIKISTRNLSNSEGTYTCSIYDIAGCSSEFSSEELSAFIEQERLRIQNADEIGEEEKNSYTMMWRVFGILLAVTLLFLGIYALFRKGLKKQYENNDNEIEDRDP